MERQREDETYPGPNTIAGVGVGVVAIAVFAVCSLGAVPVLSYGIRYNGFNKYADVVNVYDAGRHFIGPWSDFLLFPASVQSIEFSNELRLRQLGRRYPALHTRTKEGLALHLQVSLQYSLIKEHVGLLYKEFNTDYEVFFVGQIRDTLIRVAAEYEGFELWEKRAEVGRRMQEITDEVLKQTYARCWGLQLMVIELPHSFDNSIIKTQVCKQNISTMEFKQTALQIQAATAVISAEFDKKVKVIKAGGEANRTLRVRTARAEAKSTTLQKESEVLEQVKARLNLHDDDLLEYQEYTAVSVLSNASIFFGFDEGSGVLLQQGDAPPAAPPQPGGAAGAGRRLSSEL